MEQIKCKDISIIVQGPIHGDKKAVREEQITRICCERLRVVFPKAEIVLSTWEGSDVSHIDYDILVENNDPGFIQMTLGSQLRANNTNRMIVSTINGLNQATRPYCMKIRSDMLVNGREVLGYLGEFSKKTDLQIVKQKILTLSAMHPVRSGILFAVNDWFYFGLKEDLQSLYSIPLQSKMDLKINPGEEFPSWENNIVAEQYVWMNFLKKYPYYDKNINMNKLKDSNPKLLEIFEKSIANNLILLSAKEINVDSLKYHNKNYVTRNFLRMSCYTHTEWKKMYRKYVDQNFMVSINMKDFLDLALYKAMYFAMNNFSIIYKVGRKIYRMRKS